MADQNQNQNQNQAAQDAQRKAQADRAAADRATADKAASRSAQDTQQANRQRFDADKRAVAERPQQSGNDNSQPTPTQQENDEIAAGLRHIDDKEDDRSGPDVRYEMRRVEADQSRGKYETR